MAIDLTNILPNWQLVIFVGLFILFLVVGIILIIYFYGKKVWSYKVLVLESQAGKGSQPKYRDRAKLVSIGDGGEEVFYLKKLKKYRVAYGNYIGQNYLCWTIGKDGYWYNTTFGDVNRNLLEVGVIPVDRDMRYATSSLRKLVQTNYQNKSFLEKYGAIVYFGLFFLTLLIFAGIMWFAFDKQLEIASANVESIKASESVMGIAQQVLSSIENICNGGSGFIAT